MDGWRWLLKSCKTSSCGIEIVRIMVIYTQAVGKKGFLNRSAEKKKGSSAEIKLC